MDFIYILLSIDKKNALEFDGESILKHSLE